jgi:hypothetical protein
MRVKAAMVAGLCAFAAGAAPTGFVSLSFVDSSAEATAGKEKAGLCRLSRVAACR